ncbi:MAG TPA: MBL fold metallo-hydrolase [Patescibacteria group bacterium]|nr:MBL fold metallo-hydrolase [Patescibacteria group bacterium]
MEITFLGTGGGTNEERFKTCIFLPLNEKNNLILDVGGGTEIINQFAKAKINPACVNHIFISHTHFDHCLGLPAFLFYLVTEKKEEMPGKMGIYSNKRIISDLKEVLRITGAGALKRWGDRLIWIDTGLEKPVRITRDCSLLAFPAKGGQELKEQDLSCLIKLSRLQKSILFTGDTTPNEYLEKYARGVDTLIHEAILTHKNVELAHRHGHSTSQDAGKLAQQAGVKQLVLTHIYRESIVKEKSLLEETMKYYSGPVQLAHDFETINI